MCDIAEACRLEWRELTPEEWERIEPLCPAVQRPYRQKVSNQQMVNALLYRRYTNIPWKELPEQFGPWQAVVKRYTRWRDAGAVQSIFDELEKMGLVPEDSQLQQQAHDRVYKYFRPWKPIFGKQRMSDRRDRIHR